jgi:hypothetical protein
MHLWGQKHKLYTWLFIFNTGRWTNSIKRVT